jgi:hypothetical protein
MMLKGLGESLGKRHLGRTPYGSSWDRDSVQRVGVKVGFSRAYGDTPLITSPLATDVAVI